MIEKIAGNDFCWKVFNRLAWLPATRVREARLRSLRNRLLSRFPLPATVAEGPFTGLVYPNLKSHGSSLLPKLLGTYESELHSTFRKWEDIEFNQIVDIGAAEGYYAVGLAKVFPNSRVSAYDTSREARKLCKQMAETNGTLNRTGIYESCTRRTLLDKDFSGGGLIICDCEGYEGDLFDEDVATHLKNCHLIIELHDSPPEGIEIRSKLLPIFSVTHAVSLISSYTDSYKAHHYQCDDIGTDPLERFVAFAEERPWQMDWLVCEPAALNERDA